MNFSIYNPFTRGIILLALSFAMTHADRVLAMDAEPFQNHEQTLLQVTTDTMGGSTLIKINVDADSNILGLREYTADGKVKEFSAQQLSRGAVLMSSGGRDVITLFFRGVDFHSGGKVELVYLTNGLLRTRATFQMLVTRLPNGWTLEVDDRRGRRSISTMFVQGKRWLGRVVGIEKVIVN